MTELDIETWKTRALAAEAEAKSLTNEYIESLFNQSVRSDKVIAEAHFLLSLFGDYVAVKPWLEANQKTADAMRGSKPNG